MWHVVEDQKQAAGVSVSITGLTLEANDNAANSLKLGHVLRATAGCEGFSMGEGSVVSGNEAQVVLRKRHEGTCRVFHFPLLLSRWRWAMTLWCWSSDRGVGVGVSVGVGAPR